MRCIALRILGDWTVFQGCHASIFGTKTAFCMPPSCSPVAILPWLSRTQRLPPNSRKRSTNSGGHLQGKEERQGGGRTWRRWKMQRKRKTMQHDLRHHPRVRARFRHESHDKTPFPSVVSVTKATNIVIFFGGRQPLHLRHILNQRQPKIHQCLILKVNAIQFALEKALGNAMRVLATCEKEIERESIISLEGH